MITLEIRLFNKLQGYAADGRHRFALAVPAGTTIRELLDRLKIPAGEVYLALRNGRNIELFPDGDSLRDGEIVALSGPVPYSKGYGSPVI